MDTHNEQETTVNVNFNVFDRIVVLDGYDGMADLEARFAGGTGSGDPHVDGEEGVALGTISGFVVVVLDNVSPPSGLPSWLFLPHEIQKVSEGSR